MSRWIAPALSVMALSTMVAEAGPERWIACAPLVMFRPLMVSPVPSTKKVKDTGPVSGIVDVYKWGIRKRARSQHRDHSPEV